MQIVLYILSGLAGGVIGGMGMGGGTLLIPLLALLGVEQHMSQAVNLIVFIPMSAVALIIHIKNKLVNFFPLVFFPAVLTAVIGSLIAVRLDAGSLRTYFGIFLIVLGTAYLGQELMKKYFAYTLKKVVFGNYS